MARGLDTKRISPKQSDILKPAGQNQRYDTAYVVVITIAPDQAGGEGACVIARLWQFPLLT